MSDEVSLPRPPQRARIVERSWWPVAATALVELWALVFWWLFLVQLAYDHFQIGLGLGGALYPVFFTPPIVAGVAAYQVLVRRLGNGSSTRAVMALTVVIPSLIVTILLVLLCPTDGPGSLPQLLWRAMMDA